MTRKTHRHPFRFKLPNGEVFTSWAHVRHATRGVELNLTADDVRGSMALKGVGNTQTCSMAVCAKRQAAAFPHPVEGFIDWQYTTAYVVTKRSRETGLPIACVAYAHRDNIAKVNDTKGGQKQLLAELEANGDRVIRLLPIKKQKPRPGRARGKNDGSRSTRTISAVGAKLRFAVAQLGGVP